MTQRPVLSCCLQDKDPARGQQARGDTAVLGGLLKGKQRLKLLSLNRTSDHLIIYTLRRQPKLPIRFSALRRDSGQAKSLF